MLYYDWIDLSEWTDVTKVDNSKKCIVYYYWHFNHGFKFYKSVCNGCQDLLMLCFNTSDITIITDKGIDYRCIIHGISKSDAIHFLENPMLDDPGYT